jgi:putative heme-binding domain-containing protein
MTRTLYRRLSGSLLVFVFCLAPLGFYAQSGQNLQARIMTGGKLFAGSCSNSYCHGSAGSGGGGPKLKDRNFTPEHLTRVITDGIPGTGMPAFKNSYDQNQIAQIVAYVLSLSPNNPNSGPNLNTSGPNSQTAGKPQSGTVDAHFNGGAPAIEAEERRGPAKPEGSSPTSTLADESFDLRGDAMAGRELFFGAAQIDNCRVCHTVRSIGGMVGPDLTGMVDRSPRQLLQSIVSPSASIAERYQTIAVTTRDGARFIGVKRDENEQVIRIYDTSSLPPVSRALQKSEVVKIERLPRSAMPGDYGSRYTLKQLLDLISFLKSNDPAKSLNVGSKDL